jgi:hypothetical protein
MKDFKPEVTGTVYESGQRGSAAAKLSEEKFIAEILSRYEVDPHILEGKDIEEAYADCGPVNLELAR